MDARWLESWRHYRSRCTAPRVNAGRRKTGSGVGTGATEEGDDFPRGGEWVVFSGRRGNVDRRYTSIYLYMKDARFLALGAIELLYNYSNMNTLSTSASASAPAHCVSAICWCLVDDARCGRSGAAFVARRQPVVSVSRTHRRLLPMLLDGPTSENRFITIQVTLFRHDLCLATWEKRTIRFLA